MNRSGFIKWFLPADVLVGLAGAVASVVASGTLRTVGQVVLGAAILVMLAVTAASVLRALRVRRGSDAMEGYKCPSCSYVPKVHDIKTAEAYPCPRCGQPVYKKP